MLKAKFFLEDWILLTPLKFKKLKEENLKLGMIINFCFMSYNLNIKLKINFDKIWQSSFLF